MIRVQRLESIGVVAVAFAGMVSAAAAALGMIPATPPQVVGGLVGLLVITKAAVAAAGMLAFARCARVRTG